SVDVRFEKDSKTLIVIDTAGMRKKRHMVTNDIEFYSFHRAERSIRRADVVMMLINGDEHVSEPDKKLAAYIAEQYKPVILVVNKRFAQQTPSTPRGQRVRVYYATQAAVGPPTIVLFVNDPKLVSESYQRFMINRFRELLPYAEVPIRLEFRGRVKGQTPEEI